MLFTRTVAGWNFITTTRYFMERCRCGTSLKLRTSEANYQIVNKLFGKLNSKHEQTELQMPEG